MNFRVLPASVGPRGRLLALLATTALAVSFAVDAQAQTPAPAAPPAPKKGRPPPARPRPHPPAAAQAQPPANGQAQPQDQQVQLIYAPWTKFCLKGQDAN